MGTSLGGLQSQLLEDLHKRLKTRLDMEDALSQISLRLESCKSGQRSKGCWQRPVGADDYGSSSLGLC